MFSFLLGVYLGLTMSCSLDEELSPSQTRKWNKYISGELIPEPRMHVQPVKYQMDLGFLSKKDNKKHKDKKTFTNPFSSLEFKTITQQYCKLILEHLNKLMLVQEKLFYFHAFR